jgi:uncharacterized sulfatase
MNIVFIFTDTTNQHHLGCYGSRGAKTPHTDRLAAEGMRFDNSYSSSPVCTPARGCVFTGVHAVTNGAWYNDATPYSNVKMMGEVFAEAGCKVGYSGKWHLDGGLYLGLGKAQGGFPQEWWYDGRCYADDIGPEMEKRWRQFTRGGHESMLENAFAAEDCWAHRVTDRAIDFLEKAGDEPFLFVAAFDEPHGPYMCPREYLEAADPGGFEMRPNVHDSLDGKPRHQRIAAAGHVNCEEDLRAHWRYYSACNTFVDDQVGRLVAAVDRLHGDDTIVVFSSDHGEQMGSHGTWGKGYVMYEENIKTPLIVRGPGVRAGGVSRALVGQVDFLPTFCQLAEIDAPAQAQGRSFAPVLRDPNAQTQDYLYVTYTRFGNDGVPSLDTERDASWLIEGRGRMSEFYPSRTVLDGRYKLVVNLLDTDELYDLREDPYEMSNLIDDSLLGDVRTRLHEALLEQMQRTRDPLRSSAWVYRNWSARRDPHRQFSNPAQTGEQ